MTAGIARIPLDIRPLTPARWGDLECLFGPERGASSGCWCMWWRLPRSTWKQAPRAERKAAFAGVVRAGPPPGLLAYAEGQAVGWVAVAPRDATPRFNVSPVARPEDAAADLAATWAVTCFYVAPKFRRRGLMRRLIAAALAHARAQGAASVEACPKDLATSSAEVFVGVTAAFACEGFREIARRSPTRPLMRRELGGASGRHKG